MNDTQINSVVNLLHKFEPDFQYSLSVFDPSSDSIGLLIPQTNTQVFFHFIQHVDFKKFRPIDKIKFVPNNLSKLKLEGNILYLNNQNELVDPENSQNSYFSMGENWSSINHLSIYLLILLLFLMFIDTSFKFQVLK